jgi:hypothetical protein
MDQCFSLWEVEHALHVGDAVVTKMRFLSSCHHVLNAICPTSMKFLLVTVHISLVLQQSIVICVLIGMQARTLTLHISSLLQAIHVVRT